MSIAASACVISAQSAMDDRVSQQHMGTLVRKTSSKGMRLLCSNWESPEETSGDDSVITDGTLPDSTDALNHPTSQTFDQRKSPADTLSGILMDLKLCDWEIRQAELEIMTRPDGSKAILGAGAFGQVRWMRSIE